MLVCSITNDMNILAKRVVTRFLHNTPTVFPFIINNTVWRDIFSCAASILFLSNFKPVSHTCSLMGCEDNSFFFFHVLSFLLQIP